jgi:hypothetical protein
MRTPLVAGAVVILALAAGGYYGFDLYSQRRFHAGLDQALATLPPGTTATYQDARYAVLSRRAVVTGLTLHGEIPGNPPQPFDITVASLETDHPSLSFPFDWASAAANPASSTQDTVLPVADSVTMKGVTVRSAVLNLTEESIRITALRVYPWALLHDGMPSWQDIQASLAPRSQPPRLDDLRPILRAEAAAMLGVAYDGYEAGAAKATETLPGIDIEYDIHKMTGEAFDRGVLRGGTGEGITVRGTLPGAVSIDRVAIGATDFRAPLVRLVNGEALSPALLDGIRIGRIEYHGITAQPPGQPTLHIGGVSIGPIAFTEGMPVAGELAWNDVSVSESQLTNPQARDAFEKLDLDTITTSFALSYDWDVARQRAALHDTVLKVNELGTLTLSADLTNVAAGTGALAQARLAHATLRFEDASLVDRLLRAGAARTGTAPATYRRQIEDLVRRQSVADGGGNPAMAAAAQAAGDFIASPRSLTIELSPPVPVPVMTLQSLATAPAAAAILLGVTVSANQP